MQAPKWVKLILERLPLPDGCSILGEASYHREVDDAGGAFMLRRNLILDVSPRIPAGTALQQEAVECSDDEIFYLNLQDSLREEFAEIILTMFGAEPYPLRSFGLSHERGADTKFFLFKQGSLLIRSSIGEQEEGRTEWKIDLFLLIYK